MIWPPTKAWTSNCFINGQRHFVAINYGGEDLDKWVILMSVIDSSVILKVSLQELDDKCKWNIGWDDKEPTCCYNLSDKTKNSIEINLIKISTDSGLTIPISKKRIRPWF